MPEKENCCFAGCEREAEFEIIGSRRTPDDYTYSCEEHVGPLLGSPVGMEESTAWTVVYIGEPAPLQRGW